MTTSIYQRAIDAFGEENQINKAIEECAEFISAVFSHKNKESIVDEIADVTIVMDQMRLVYVVSSLDVQIAEACAEDSLAVGELWQIQQAVKHCANFIAATAKNTVEGIEDIGETIHKVAISMSVMRVIYGPEIVDERIALKLKRLEQLIADKSDK